MTDKVLFTQDQDKIAWLTLNRPEIHNALDNDMIQKILDCLKILHEDTSLRALVISGNGENFCSGDDLHWMKESSQVSESENVAEANLFSYMFYSLDRVPLPVITYVHGTVKGGGIGFLACSDIVVSEAKVLFGFPEVKLGLIPAMISPYVLRSTYPGSIERYLLTGEAFDALTALRVGLVHEIVKGDSKEKALEPLLRCILTAGPEASRQMKKIFFQLKPEITEKIRQLTVESIAHLHRSVEGQQGVKAFLENKSPSWIPERYR